MSRSPAALALVAAAAVFTASMYLQAQAPANSAVGSDRSSGRPAGPAALLHQLSQRAVEDGVAGARRRRPSEGRHPPRDLGEGRHQAPHHGDAAGRAAAARRGDLRSGGDLARDRARSCIGVQPEPGRPSVPPSSESQRVQERGPRPAGARRSSARDGDRRPPPGRRCELRLRQYRRRARDVADAHRTLSVGGAEDQPPGRGRRVDAADRRHLQDPAAAPAGGSVRRPSLRHARRHPHRALLSARRRVHVPHGARRGAFAGSPRFGAADRRRAGGGVQRRRPRPRTRPRQRRTCPGIRDACPDRAGVAGTPGQAVRARRSPYGGRHIHQENVGGCRGRAASVQPIRSGERAGAADAGQRHDFGTRGGIRRR